MTCLEINKIHNGDCLELMKDIPSKNVNMILCDLPYGTTRNKWDNIIDIKLLWLQYERIIKDIGIIILTAQTPFTEIIGSSNLKMLKYKWCWIKQQGTGFLNSKKMPLKATEDILVFYKKIGTYNPQMRTGFKPYIAKRKDKSYSDNYGKQKCVNTINTTGNRFPLNWIEFKYNKEKLHPTQKPVELFEYLIKTYSNEGDLILDNCAGSGTTGVACKNLNRNFILIELDKNYCDIANKRLAQKTLIGGTI